MTLTTTFSALSDQNRRMIIDLLKKKEMSVSEMLSYLSVTMPTLSHHLDILRRAGLVASRRNGQQILYSLNITVLDEVTEQIMKFLKKW